MDELSEKINSEYKKEPIREKDAINKMKNTLEGINNRLEDTEEQIGHLEDRVMESCQVEQQKKEKEKEMRELWEI